MPSDIQPNEIIYVEKLRQAYCAHTGATIPHVAAITNNRLVSRHFERQRRAFYYAEGLREFSKDTVPAGTFEAMQEDIRCGVQPVVDEDHSSPLVRLNAVIKHAVTLPLSNSPLASIASSLDRHGVCHQLSNDDKLNWDGEADV